MAKTSKVSEADPVTEDVVIRIRALAPSLSPAEQRVAQLVLEDPSRASARTITELARAAGTSETTVIRFCKVLGLPGYPELRLRLAAESARESAREGDRGRVVGSDIGPDDTMEQIVEKVAFNDARAVEETARQLDIDTLDVVSETLARAPRIEIFGVGASAFVALDFQAKLHRIGRMSFAWADTHAALASAALLGKGDVAVGISHTGTTGDTIEVLTEARNRGATTVALTNFPRSPIASVADHVLTTAARETTFRSGATASRIAQLTVIDCLFVGIARRHYRETLDALEVTYAAVSGRRVSASRGRR
ncbi:MurR/RpiR family transcriptional regulator [Actinopolymorpha alba]|uniref:MurR/RpiR family transcriptional regulator n=1 Tax=Actinopolymorpha alba TaxID=533267 RepID=UPI00035D8FEA|nr:MurR/RpiR family transcriptional regulator [Actinopolymorpha alba]